MQNPVCNHCRRRQLAGQCWKQSRACFYCGDLGHIIRDCPKNTTKPQNAPTTPSTPAQSYQSRGPREIQSGASSRGCGSSSTLGEPWNKSAQVYHVRSREAETSNPRLFTHDSSFWDLNFARNLVRLPPHHLLLQNIPLDHS
ncbi:hypothetical protein V6N13_124967 [Hibiscus sabdariffa]